MNEAKVIEYTNDQRRTGDPTGYFYKMIKMHLARVQYARFLRTKGAFYDVLIRGLSKRIKPDGKIV